MIWRINKFTLTNFKLFKGAFTLEPCGSNVLLYAENGCGKSSIFWGFYTLYESCKKDASITGAQKYFDWNNEVNLRNKFSGRTDYSGLKIEFIDKEKHIRTYEDSSALVNTKESASVFMPLTRSFSDFLHYRHLSSLFDFKNSEENNVFEIFKTELFPYLDFPATISTRDFELNVKAWWDKISNGKDQFIHRINRQSPIYKDYQESIKDFNKGLRRLLESIIEGANRRIENDFYLPVELVCDYSDCVYDKHIGNRQYDKVLYPPKIVLTAKMKHSLLQGGEANIGRMKSFFNEAKISCVSLALRLAILDLKASVASADYARTLFIDDLLISLDMSNRLRIIDVILRLSSKYQIFLFTHDKALYNLVGERVNDKKWKKYELVPLADFTTGGVPDVKLVNNLTPILWAHKYFKRGEFYACANSLRKECERQVKRLLRKQEVWSVNSEGEAQMRSLSQLIDSLPIFFSDHGMPNLIPNIQTYRRHILNPGSHDDVENPIYRGELQLALTEIEKLSLIEYCPIAANPLDGEYEISVTNGAFHSTTKLQFLSPLSVAKYGGKYYWGNPGVVVAEEDGMALLVPTQSNYAKVFTHLCNRAHGLDSALVDKLDCCKRVSDGKTLKETINM